MRIGLITGEFPPQRGGVGDFTQQLRDHLMALGHHISVLTGGSPRPDDHASVKRNIRRWDWRTYAIVNDWAQRENLDVLNLQFQTAAYNMSPWVHFLPDRCTHPIVTTFHDLRFPYLLPKAGPLRPWIVRHLARTSAGVIVTNHEDQQQFANLSSVCMIPIGSNITPAASTPDQRNDLRHATGLPDDAACIAYFGFLNHSKGIDTLLEALALLPDAYRLVMVGDRTGSSDPTNAASAADIDRLIAERNLANRIIRTGFADADNVSLWLQTADVVALPYRDGASLRRGTLMAALRHGCAIVTTTPQIEIPEFVHGENMLLIPPDHPQALADAIQGATHDAALLSRLRTGAHQLSDLYDWEQIARRTADFLESVLR